MLMRKTLPLLVAFLLAPVVFAQQYNVVDDFLSEMNQEITGGNVSSGSHISEEVPEELQGIEVLWGYTCKADGSPATYVWVFAKSEDGMISGWTHTTWSDVGVPRRYDVYKTRTRYASADLPSTPILYKRSLLGSDEY